MLKDQTAAILNDARVIARVREEIKTISDADLPVVPESLFSVTLTYKQFVNVLRALMKGERTAETIAEQYEWSPALRKFAEQDKAFIGSIIETLEDLPASQIRVEEGV